MPSVSSVLLFRTLPRVDDASEKSRDADSSDEMFCDGIR
jgi:hypothetical protein